MNILTDCVLNCETDQEFTPQKNNINPAYSCHLLFSCWMTENTVMTVRRYSTSSNLSGVTTRGARINTEHNNSVWRRLQEEIQHGEDVFTNSVKAEVQKVNTRHSFQEYVHKNRWRTSTSRWTFVASLRKLVHNLTGWRVFPKCFIVILLFACFFRAKVKTVTFLLPVDDIYTSRPALIKHQEEPRVTDLASITETDSWGNF